MNIHSLLINEMKDKTYRDAYVVSQIRTALPFQLRALRTSRKWSQEYLAEKAGMAQPRISDLEQPTGRMPNLDTLCRIASACDVAFEVRFVPFSELIDRSEHFDPEHFRVPTFDQEIKEAEEREDSAVSVMATKCFSVSLSGTGIGFEYFHGDLLTAAQRSGLPTLTTNTSFVGAGERTPLSRYAESRL